MSHRFDLAAELCSNGQMPLTDEGILDAILRRRAIRAFDAVDIAPEVRERILTAACSAPSSFNIQPYKIFWIESPAKKERAAELCLGQSAATTASALAVVVADIGSWRETGAAHLRWMRETGAFTTEKIAAQESKAKIAKWFFLQGWFGILGWAKWAALRAMHVKKVIGILPVQRRGMFQWATKSASLACQNLMIAAEALGLNTCPMEGFDDLRLARFLRLRRRTQQVVMVIAIGKKSIEHRDYPRWRRPLNSTVEVL